VLSTSPLVAPVAAFLVGCVLGLTGFEFAPISVPLLLFVYGPTTVVVLTPVLSHVHQVVGEWWRISIGDVPRAPIHGVG
jgi:uncharacterized membrane protein YfcA